MAKGQSRKPGRDVRGGSGKRGVSTHTHSGNGWRRDGRGSHDGRRRDDDAVGGRNVARRGKGTSGGRGDGTRGRNGQGGTQTFIEGRRACAEALDASVPVRRALVARAAADAAADATLAALVERIAAAGIELESVPRARLDALSSHGAHQGIMLETAPFSYATLDEVIAAADGVKNALVVVADHVTDEGNLGAIVRSAEVVGAMGVVVARARAASVGVGAYKTSAGAVLHVPIARVANIATAIDQLKRAGFWAIAASEHAAATAWDAPLSGRVALVMGAEATGVSRLVLERCDLACRLPQRGRVESLNVAQAATVLCYEWLRRSYGGVDVGAASIAVGNNTASEHTANAGQGGSLDDRRADAVTVSNGADVGVVVATSDGASVMASDAGDGGVASTAGGDGDGARHG